MVQVEKQRFQEWADSEIDQAADSSGAELDLGSSDSDKESGHNEVVAMYDY